MVLLFSLLGRSLFGKLVSSWRHISSKLKCLSCWFLSSRPSSMYSLTPMLVSHWCNISLVIGSMHHGRRNLYDGCYGLIRGCRIGDNGVCCCFGLGCKFCLDVWTTLTLYIAWAKCRNNVIFIHLSSVFLLAVLLCCHCTQFVGQSNAIQNLFSFVWFYANVSRLMLLVSSDYVPLRFCKLNFVLI